jgi:hypothetical protein
MSDADPPPPGFIRDPLNQRTRPLDPRPATPFQKTVDVVLLTLGTIWSIVFAIGAALLGWWMLGASHALPVKLAGGVILVGGVATFLSLAFLSARGVVRTIGGRDPASRA